MKRAAGAILLLLYALLVVQKVQAGLGLELLYLSHVSSALLALGLLAELPLLVAACFLCQIGVALPAYALYLGTGGQSSVVSFLLHVLAPLFGWMACRGTRLPGAAPVLGFGMYIAAMAATFAFTPESMNVNVAFKPWVLGELGFWPVRVLNALLVLGLIYVPYVLWNRFGFVRNTGRDACS